MVNVCANRIIGHPSKYARHFYIIEPFLNSLLNGELNFTSSKKANYERLSISKETSKNKRIVSGVKPYREIHEIIALELERIKSKHYLFTCSSSVDQTKEGKIICYDPCAQRNAFTDELINIFRNLYDNGCTDLNEWTIVPVSPFFSPYKIIVNEDKEPKLSLCYKNLYHKKSAELNAKGSIGFGDGVKTLDDESLKHGLWQFNPALYDRNLALRSINRPHDEQSEAFEKRISEDVLFNQHLVAIMYAGIIDQLEISGEVILYSSESSFEKKIMEKALRYSGKFSLFNWKPFSGIKRNKNRMVNKTALNRLYKKIYNESEKRNTKSIKDLL